MERNRSVPGKKSRMFSQRVTKPGELQTSVSVRRSRLCQLSLIPVSS